MSGLTQSAGLKALGGQKSGRNSILCAGPGHGKRDVSLSVVFGSQYPEGFAVYSFSGDDFRQCRDHVRDKLGLPEWKPNGHKTQDQPVFKAREYIYLDAKGDEHHRVDALSDGSFRHYHYDLDGWVNGAPDFIIPYALSDLDSDETIYLVRGEENAELVRDGFGHVATTYPSGLDVHADASFLHHLADKDVVILDVGGARSAEFCSVFSEALNLPVTRLPDGVKTLREFARQEFASLDNLTTEEPASTLSTFAPTPFELGDPTQIPPREWIYDFRLIRGFVALTVAPGGLGKSSLAMVDALSMVVGRALFNDSPLNEKKQHRVWYWNGEDPQDETRRRVSAIAKYYGVTNADIGGRLFTDTGRETEIILGGMNGHEISINEKLFTNLELAIKANKIDVLMIDPFSSAHRLPENDNTAINAVARRLAKLADVCGCAVEIVHHTRKTNGNETTIEDGRGASSMRDAVRSARALNVMSSDIADAAGIPETERESYFSVADGKASMASKLGGPKWRRLVSVPLGNQTEDRDEDHVGVVTYFEMKKKDEEIVKTNNLQDLEPTILSVVAVNDMTRHWSGRSQPPKGWLGKAVIDRMGLIGVKPGTVNNVIKGMIDEGKLVIRTVGTDSCYTLPNRKNPPQPTEDDGSPF